MERRKTGSVLVGILLLPFRAVWMFVRLIIRTTLVLMSLVA